jgi:hypothetical protein
MGCGTCRGLDRRAFLEQVAAIVGVGGLAACSADLGTAPTITAFTIMLANYPSLAAVGGLALVDNGGQAGDPVAVSRIDTSTFVALSLICPHRGSTVQLVGSSFRCPTHGAMFAADGSWTGGQSTSSLYRYTTVYDPATGTLKIG